MDVDAVEPGEDFRQAIDSAIDSSAVCLVIVGEGWLEAIDPTTGGRRLDQPNDFVRLEIEAAFKQGIRVIPVLVDDAPMPSEDGLPDSMKALAWRNAVPIRHTRFNDDVDSLVGAVLRTTRPDESFEVKDSIESNRQEDKLRSADVKNFHWSSILVFVLTMAIVTLVTWRVIETQIDSTMWPSQRLLLDHRCGGSAGIFTGFPLSEPVDRTYLMTGLR